MILSGLGKQTCAVSDGGEGVLPPPPIPRVHVGSLYRGRGYVGVGRNVWFGADGRAGGQANGRAGGRPTGRPAGRLAGRLAVGARPARRRQMSKEYVLRWAGRPMYQWKKVCTSGKSMYKWKKDMYQWKRSM